MNPLVRLYVAIRQSGWLVPSATGGLLPFPFTWQAWVVFGALLAGIVATVFLPTDLGWVCRIALCIGYVGVGMISYDGK
jgi:hypothetical protein